MIGIYKITSPIGRIYIGQSVNLKRRLCHHKRLFSKSQPRLYESLVGLGVNNHIFEIIEYCEKQDLKIKERYWQDFYDCLGDNGLNCILTKTPYKLGKTHVDTSKRIAESRVGLIKSESTRKKLSERMVGKKHFMYGKKHSESAKLKMSKAWETRPNHSKETKTKQRINNRLSQLVIDLNTGVFYYSIKEYASYTNLSHRTITRHLKTKGIYNNHIVCQIN